MTTDAVITISLADMHSTEVSRLRKAVAMNLRNIEIRKRYKELRAREVPQLDAIACLAKEYNLSERQINGILWPR